MEDDAEVARRQARNLYLGFMLAVAFYMIIAIEMRRAGIEPQVTAPGAWGWILRLVFGVLSATGLALAGHVSERRPLDPPDRTRGAFSPRVQRCFAGAVLRLAFAEAIGIYGLLLTLLFGHLVDVFAFGAASIAAMAATFPTSDRWAGEIARKGGDTLA